MQKISIIIPIYNAEMTIAHYLDCLINQNYDTDNYEIILVDDGSTDKTQQIIKKYLNKHTTISYIKLDQNSGPSTARNTGAYQAKYDILAFIDSDAYADKNWLTNISLAFTQDKVLACGGMIDNYNDGFFSNISHIIEFSTYYFNHKRTVKLQASANLIYKKDIFNKLGGFDKNLRIGEDIDLNCRFIELGHKLYYYPNIIIKHDTSNNIIYSLKKHYKYGFGSANYQLKNFGKHNRYKKNKTITLFLVPLKVLSEINRFYKQEYSQKHRLKSILGIPLFILLRFIWWFGVLNYIFFFDKESH